MPLRPGATNLFYRTLHALGGFGPEAPATLRELRTADQRTPEQLIDRYRIVCRPIRDLLVDYLRERQPALDYTSLVTLATFLGNLFWADLEHHHPGIDSLHLPVEVADAWKQRLRTITKTTRTPDGRTVQSTVERINYRECLTPVRAFYLDLAHWAVEDPARWGPWVVPCPIGSEEVRRRKDKQHRKSRMDARTRERLPVLPILVAGVDQRRKDAATLLDAARRAEPGKAFTAVGQTLTRIRPAGSAAAKSGPRTRRRGNGVTWVGRKSTRSGPAPWWRCCGPPASASRNSPSCPTTAWSSTGCPPPGRWCRCCRSRRPRPMSNACWWSVPNSPTCSRRSFAGSAAQRRDPARARLRRPGSRLVATDAAAVSAPLRSRTARPIGGDPQDAQRRNRSHQARPTRHR